MRRFGLSLIFAIGLSGIWPAQFSVAQCGCADQCNSSCLCGCSDPDKYPEAARSGGGYGDSSNVTFYSQMTLNQMGVTESGVLGNDCWGWTHKPTGREFALFGTTDRTIFVEITDPANPAYLGKLTGAGSNSTWRDIKVFNNRCYIVGDGSGNNSHGVQVLDLNKLLTVVHGKPVTFTADARYTGLGRAHNIVINEDTGFAYVVGSPSQSSAGGLIMLDLNQGVMPVAAGVYSGDGYTHDAQVVKYHGPDTSAPPQSNLPNGYSKREIAFCANEDTLTIVDVTKDGNPPRLISRTTYPVSRYSHQGWLSEDHSFFYMDDELDELQLGPFPTRTRIWDVRDLDNPVYVGHFSGTETTIDHNMYVKGDYLYQANYTSGLRIVKVYNAKAAKLKEEGFFDTYGADNNLTFNGAWSCYPYFPSGSIIVSDRQNGLFVVKFNPPK